MSELIDVLATRDQTGVAGVDERQTFTTVAGLDVELDVLVPGQAILRPADSLNYRLNLKDNITILSIGVSLPYTFGLSTRGIYAILFWNDGIGAGPLNVGQANVIEIPFANYELSIGAFVPWPTPNLAPYHIEMIVGTNPYILENRVRISMVGVDAALIPGTFPVTSFVKVAHNLPFVP
jgi:hypothetical protein